MPGNDKGMKQSMSSTMGKINGVKMTEYFDVDFANMMIIHHQTAIDMSEAEIQRMEQIIQNYKMTETQKEIGEMHDELDETMKAMMGKMNSLSMTGNTDKDYELFKSRKASKLGYLEAFVSR